MSPVTVHVSAPSARHPPLPGEASTSYIVMGEPPSEAGAFQVTVTWRSPATPTTSVGALGTPGGAVKFTGAVGADRALARPSRVVRALKV